MTETPRHDPWADVELDFCGEDSHAVYSAHAVDAARAADADRLERIGAACGFPVVLNMEQLADTIIKAIKRRDDELRQLREQLTVQEKETQKWCNAWGTVVRERDDTRKQLIAAEARCATLTAALEQSDSEVQLLEVYVQLRTVCKQANIDPDEAVAVLTAANPHGNKP